MGCRKDPTVVASQQGETKRTVRREQWAAAPGSGKGSSAAAPLQKHCDSSKTARLQREEGTGLSASPPGFAIAERVGGRKFRFCSGTPQRRQGAFQAGTRLRAGRRGAGRLKRGNQPPLTHDLLINSGKLDHTPFSVLCQGSKKGPSGAFFACLDGLLRGSVSCTRATGVLTSPWVSS